MLLIEKPTALQKLSCKTSRASSPDRKGGPQKAKRRRVRRRLLFSSTLVLGPQLTQRAAEAPVPGRVLGASVRLSVGRVEADRVAEALVAEHAAEGRALR